MAKSTKSYLQSIWQPRVVMGLALTLFSFGTVAGHTRVECLWETAQTTFAHATDRARQCGETIRFVYRLEHRLNDLERRERRQNEASAASLRCSYVAVRFQAPVPAASRR